MKTTKNTTVEWKKAIFRNEDDDNQLPAFQLLVNGHVVLNAVSTSNIQEAVNSKDRKMIGQAIANYLAEQNEL